MLSLSSVFLFYYDLYKVLHPSHLAFFFQMSTTEDVMTDVERKMNMPTLVQLASDQELLQSLDKKLNSGSLSASIFGTAFMSWCILGVFAVVLIYNNESIII